MIHQPLSPDRVHVPNGFVPEIVSPWSCSSGLVRHILPFVYFFKGLISFIGSLDKCHTSVCNALILFGGISFFFTRNAPPTLNAKSIKRKIVGLSSFEKLYNTFREISLV